MTASLTLRADGTVLDASPDALALLAITLDELRELPPGAFSPDEPDPEADAAFRAQWEAEGRPDIAGQATLQRLDGSKVRVRFGIQPGADDGFVVVLERMAAPVDAPPVVYTGGRVMAEWRAAERRLREFPPDSPESAVIQAEIDRLRSIYQGLFPR